MKLHVLNHIQMITNLFKHKFEDGFKISANCRISEDFLSKMDSSRKIKKTVRNALKGK